MARTRPAVLTVMGILNIVIGGLTLLCGLCVGSLFLFTGALFRQPMPVPMGPGGQPFGDVWEATRQQLAWYSRFAIGIEILNCSLAIALIVTGIGLLTMGRWARVASIVCGVVAVVTQLAGFVVRFTYVYPELDRLQRTQQPALQRMIARQPGMPLGPQPT